MFENQGIDLSGSLLASWVGKSTKLLERLSDAIRDHVFAAQAIFMDDTTVKLLQKGQGKGRNKPKTARLWVVNGGVKTSQVAAQKSATVDMACLSAV